MLVQKWVTPNPVTVTAATPITEASRPMKEHGMRHFPVLEGDTLALERVLEADHPDVPVHRGW
ncbi:MAG: CBS domain-containing protein [Thermodesulfobacteriota bacterium]